MKIFQLNDSIAIYDVNTTQKFDLLKDDLMVAARIMQDHKVMNDMPIADYLGILRKQLETQYDKFKLLAGMDLDTKKVNSYMAAFIAVDDNQQPACMIYGAYFLAGLLRTIMPSMIMYLDIWSVPFGCKETVFSTSRKNPEAYERLLSPFQFHPTHTVFKRKIEVH